MTVPTHPEAEPAAARDPEDLIAAHHARIDDLDARVIALFQERTAVSQAVQQARVASWGRRGHLAREMENLRSTATRSAGPARRWRWRCWNCAGEGREPPVRDDPFEEYHPNGT